MEEEIKKGKTLSSSWILYVNETDIPESGTTPGVDHDSCVLLLGLQADLVP